MSAIHASEHPQSSPAAARILNRIAAAIGCRNQQAEAAVALLDEGATVPFIARYRKEATGGLDDTQLRTLAERLAYLRELEERRASILAAIDEQGALTPELAAQIDVAETKQTLEDLYLPQVAAYADAHYRIEKHSDGKETQTRVTALDDEARITEIARMLGSADSDTSREHARSMLARKRAGTEQD